MIGHLRGEVVASGPAEVVLEVGGVGYLVVPTRRALEGLPGPGQPARLLVRQVVREESLTLYGFADGEERRTFDLLLGVTGVGPRLALAILGHLTPGQLRQAVAGEDLGRLTRVPGVGRKTAERIVLELRPWAAEGPAAPAAGGGGGELAATVAEALALLGYGPAEVHQALDALGPMPAQGAPEEWLRRALRHLGPAEAGRSAAGGEGR